MIQPPTGYKSFCSSSLSPFVQQFSSPLLIYGTLIYLTKFLGSCVKTGCKFTAHFSSLSFSLFSTSAFSLLIAHYNTCSNLKKIEQYFTLHHGACIIVHVNNMCRYQTCRSFLEEMKRSAKGTHSSHRSISQQTKPPLQLPVKLQHDKGNDYRFRYSWCCTGEQVSVMQIKPWVASQINSESFRRPASEIISKQQVQFRAAGRGQSHLGMSGGTHRSVTDNLHVWTR